MSEYLFTSESVSEGHPDKVADQISDAVLDAILAQDKFARVAAETLVNTGLVVMAGEITTNAVVDFQTLARQTARVLGDPRQAARAVQHSVGADERYHRLSRPHDCGCR